MGIQHSRDGKVAARRGRAASGALIGFSVVALVAGLIWWIAGGQTADSGSATSPHESASEAEGYDPPTFSALDKAQGARHEPAPLPAAAPASSPVEAIESEAPAGWHDLRGIAVRAADDSPVAGLTVIVVPAANLSSETGELRVLSGEDGGFTLRVPDGAVNFGVLLPASNAPREQAADDGRVAVRVEWPDGDTSGDDVRLVVESGWRLDLQLVDGEGQPHEGVLVRGAGRAARSDRTGRCSLLDLPLNGEPTTLTLQAGPAAQSMTYVVQAPEPGSLRKEELFKVP